MNICKMLNIEMPIIQAPMAGVQDWQLAVAVSNAGGLGSIPCGMLSNEQIVEEIEQFKKHSTKPYNLNFFCHDMPELNLQALKTWEKTLSPYFESYNIELANDVSGLRVPFDEGIADTIEPFKPPVISFHFGLPSASLVKRVKSWGTIILSSATTLEEALWLQDNGADIIIAQGIEAGGHRALFLNDDLSTQLPTVKLLNILHQTLSIPVIAAGGIANHCDVKNMIELGASAVQVGTSYILCYEAKTSHIHRKAISSEETPTALTNLFSGRVARGIINNLMTDLDFINDVVPEFPYASVSLAPLRAKAEEVGKCDFTPLWAGTNRSGCAEISAAELTAKLWGNMKID